jgi:ABC-type uncharacterized transport system involved in gliding motility auxiliary subunit
MATEGKAAMNDPNQNNETEQAEFAAGSRRAIVQGSTLSVGVVLVAVLLVFANYFGWKYHQRFDWTKSELYTLSEKSQQVVRELAQDIEVVVFLRPGSEVYDQTKELLERYAAASPRITVREVDAEKNLAEAQSLVDKYQVSSLNVVVFDSGTDRRVVEETDLADYDYSGTQFGQGPTLTGFKGEQKFTSVILELSQNAKPKILFTTGHGERSIDDRGGTGMAGARELLGRDNVTIEEWASLGQDAVPEGTNLVVIAGPTLGFTEPELATLGRYVDAGGRLLVLLDPALQGDALAPTGLEPWLANYGIQVGANIVVDPSNPLPFFGAETIFAASYGDHPITKALSQANVPAIFALSRSVAVGGGTADLERVELVKTSTEGWGETNLAALGDVRRDESDLAGPVSLAVAVAPKAADSGSGLDGETLGEGGDAAPDGASPAASAVGRIVVFGDSDFATNGQINNVGNPTLLANTINWLLERESLIGIAAKAPEQVRLNLTSAQVRSIYLLVLLLMPGLAITLGIFVWLRRRR